MDPNSLEKIPAYQYVQNNKPLLPHDTEMYW